MTTRTLSQHQSALQMTYPAFVFRTLVREGHAPESLLSKTGLTGNDLADPEFEGGFGPLRRLLLNAMELTGEPHLAIRIAREFEASFIGLPAYTAMNAATFEEALAVLSRFFHLPFPAIAFIAPDKDAVVRSGEFAIRLQPKIPLGDVSYFASISALVACEGLCNAILRVPKTALRGELNVGRPEGWEHVEGQMGFPIRFEAPAVRLFLPSMLLDRALPAADPLNHPRLRGFCEIAAERAKAKPDSVRQVVSFLEEEENLALTISQVAKALGYSERGLRRHLERSGTSFRALINEIRERRARDMLATTALPIKNIAHALGFDTPSNFTRSFKHWTGTSPSTFRLDRTRRSSLTENE